MRSPGPSDVSGGRSETSRPLKICYLGWGDHVHLERWAGYFSRAGHSVTVISVSRRGTYPAQVGQHRLGFEKRSLRWKRLRLRWLLWRIRPHLVHVHWAHFAAIAAGIWHGPLIVTAWGSDLYRLGEFSASEVQRLREGLRAAAVVTCDSHDLARVVKEVVGDRSPRVEVVQWGVDTSWFKRLEGECAFAHELGIAGRPVIFSARNFQPVYNQEAIVAAFARVRAEIPDAMLLMKNYGGNLEYRYRIEEQMRILGVDSSVRIADAVSYERMPELYSAATVTVSVPFFDATPMALLEAMACGSVPIVSDLPSLREWVVDGENGFLVDPRDVDGLAERIIRVLRKPATREAMAVRNANLIKARASQQANMAQMDDIYRDVADGHSPS
jgi:L-malate glycosyltransferase